MGRRSPLKAVPTASTHSIALSKRRQDKAAATMKVKNSYHHGDLRAALITAADEIITEKGIEGFSLRAAAQRAGVSPAAPAHHFGGARGLLTEVAILAYERAGRYIESAGHSQDAATDVRAVMLAFVKFVVENPGHFRLMFRKDLVDRSDSRLVVASRGPGNRIGHAVLAYSGKAHADPACFDDSAEMLCGLATLHGLASLVLEEKAAHFFRGANTKNFLEEYLPRVIDHLYPPATQRRSP